MKANDLYQQLSNVYGSPYPDKNLEKKAAIRILEKSIKENLELIELIPEKLRQVMQQQNMKCKLCALIEDKFWTKNFTQPIVIRRFNPNQV